MKKGSDVQPCTRDYVEKWTVKQRIRPLYSFEVKTTHHTRFYTTGL